MNPNEYRQVLIEQDGRRRTLERFVCGSNIHVARPIEMTAAALLGGHMPPLIHDVYELSAWEPAQNTAYYRWARADVFAGPPDEQARDGDPS